MLNCQSGPADHDRVPKTEVLCAPRTTPRRSQPELQKWLSSGPSFADLAAEFPTECRKVESEVGQLFASGKASDVEAYVASLRSTGRPRKPGIGGRRGEEAILRDSLHEAIALALLRQIRLQTSAGVKEGTVRFNFVNGYLAQRLLFARALERKPVSLAWFRLVWPLIWQKRRLLPLVERKGIYCFYSKRLIHDLASMIGSRPCLEIGAGDGTLARFLADAGVQIVATDDYSWKQSVSYPQDVVRQDAISALRRRRPEVVICSWPPAGNRFEREVFRTSSVELYIVIGSRTEANSGNWLDYRSQKDFELQSDELLAELVLPPETDASVLVFRRR